MKDSTKRKIRFLSVLLFILYVLLLVYFLFFSEEYGRVTAEERVYRYNLVPFVGGVISNHDVQDCERTAHPNRIAAVIFLIFL